MRFQVHMCLRAESYAVRYTDGTAVHLVPGQSEFWLETRIGTWTAWSEPISEARFCELFEQFGGTVFKVFEDMPARQMKNRAGR